MACDTRAWIMFEIFCIQLVDMLNFNKYSHWHCLEILFAILGKSSKQEENEVNVRLGIKPGILYLSTNHSDHCVTSFPPFFTLTYLSYLPNFGCGDLNSRHVLFCTQVLWFQVISFHPLNNGSIQPMFIPHSWFHFYWWLAT